MPDRGGFNTEAGSPGSDRLPSSRWKPGGEVVNEILDRDEALGGVTAAAGVVEARASTMPPTGSFLEDPRSTRQDEGSEPLRARARPSSGLRPAWFRRQPPATIQAGQADTPPDPDRLIASGRSGPLARDGLVGRPEPRVIIIFYDLASAAIPDTAGPAERDLGLPTV